MIKLHTINFSSKLEDLQESTASLHPEESKIEAEIIDTKILKDMDKNTYTLTEYEPSDYMIFHNASGVFVERHLSVHRIRRKFILFWPRIILSKTR